MIEIELKLKRFLGMMQGNEAVREQLIYKRYLHIYDSN